MPRPLHHVTLSTGDDRESPRARVGSDVIQILAPLLAAIARGEEVEVPRVEPACTMTGAAGGDCLILTVWGPPDGEQPIPLATVGIARGPAESDRLWILLHETAVGIAAVTPADQAPPLPWCGARLEVGITLYLEAAHWLGDFERCLAWTWIERGTTSPPAIRPPPPSARPTRSRAPAAPHRGPRRRRR
jgi:hypothetical protein